MGWNLGNTLDAYGHNQGLKSEMSWGNQETTEEMIEKLVDSGFIFWRIIYLRIVFFIRNRKENINRENYSNSIRIPVTWHNHIIDDNYTIESKWMERIKTIVNLGIKHGLYIIVNTHHDNYEKNEEPLTYAWGYYPLKRDIIESEKFIYLLLICFHNK